jgi:hypothetical protein
MNFNHWLLFLKGSKLILLFFAAYFNTTNIFNPSVMNLRFIAVFLFLTLAASALQAQTADEVIARYEAAAGGREKLEAIRYLEINSNLAMGMMGRTIDLPLTLVKEKGKLFRRQIGGIMGMGDSFTMITDTAGYIYIPAMRGFGDMQGTEAITSRIPDAEVAAQQYELDCAGAFGDLVNYAAKGHKAEFVGTEKVTKVPCYKVKLTLKTGQLITYYFDSQTGLVKQMEATGDMAANISGFGSMMKAFGRGMKKDDKATLYVKEYKDVNGVKFPAKYTLGFGPIESEIENLAIKVNEGLEEKWYHVK